MGEKAETGRSPELARADGVAGLLTRVREHRIVQWALGYVAVAYGIQHAITLTSEALDWPHGVVRMSMILLALGLPIAITLAWYHGERASRRLSTGEFSILAVLLVGVSILFYAFVRPQAVAVPAVVTASKVVNAPAPVTKPNGISVAVLPFLNLSGDSKEEYFSDGMTEEITSALANVKELKVVARTSAFAFKGKNEDVRTIGQALTATDIIEGSVRKEGNEVRITAQLIRTDSGDHLWTQSYDRELKDVFAVQEDIARAIAASLRVPLGLSAGENLVSNRTSDTAAYEDYLRALALYRARDIKNVIAVLKPMVKRDPSYAPAWALLALAHDLAVVYLIEPTTPLGEQRAAVNSAFNNARRAAHEALRLDPRSALGYSALGQLEEFEGHWATADGEFEKALALDPADPDTLQVYSLDLMSEGRLSRALKMRTTLRQLEPFVPIYNVQTANAVQGNGDIKNAFAILNPIAPIGPVGAIRDNYLALAYASTGQYERAAETILAISPNQPRYSSVAVKQAADILRKAPAKVTEPEPTLASESYLSWVYAFVGARERVIDNPERDLAAGRTAAEALLILWHPSLAAVRKTEQFKTLVRKTGLVDYWRAKGWPQFCHPISGNDFTCN